MFRYLVGGVMVAFSPYPQPYPAYHISKFILENYSGMTSKETKLRVPEGKGINILRDFDFICTHVDVPKVNT